MAFLGFVASSELHNLLVRSLREKNSSQNLVEIRNHLIELLLKEHINALFIPIQENLDRPTVQASIAKLQRYIESVIDDLLRRICLPCSNKQAKLAVNFLSQHLITQTSGSTIVGTELPSFLSTNLNDMFAQICSGKKIDKALVIENYKQLSEFLIRHYIYTLSIEFNLSMSERKTVDQHITQLTQAIYPFLEQWFIELSKTELSHLARAHKCLIFN